MIPATPSSRTSRRTPLEVLAEVADDEARDEDERRDDGELLRDLALALDDLRLMVVADACKEIAGDVELFRHPNERLVGVGEEALDLGREERVVAHLDAAVEHAADGRARRRDGPSSVEELVPEIRESCPDLARRRRVDRVLELLDLGVDGVERLEERVRDLVDQSMDERPP